MQWQCPDTFVINMSYSDDIRCTVEPLFYDHPQNQIGVVVKEGWSSTRGLTIFITCALWYTRIYYCSNSFVHVENVFRRVHCRTRENAATYPLQRLQARPRSPRLKQRRPPTATFSNNNAVSFLYQSTQHFDIGPYKPTFRKHRSNIGSHI